MAMAFQCLQRSGQSSQKVEIEVLSPLHVGDGQRLTPLDYVRQGNTLVVYTFDNLLKAIEKEPFQRAQNLYCMLKNKLEEEKEKLPELKELIDYLKVQPEPAYSLKIRGELGAKQVETFVKDLRAPYLPGSELKGALRVLFLCGILLEDTSLTDGLIGKLKESANSRDKLSEVQKWVEEQVFYPEGIKGKSQKELQGQPQNYDLFRCIEISDSEPIDCESLVLENPLLVGSRRALYPCEAVKEGTMIKTTIKVDHRLLKELSQTAERLGMRYKYINKLSLEKLKEFSKKFYTRLIDTEIEFFNKNRQFSVVKHLETIKSYTDKGILLRIGKHEGYLSTTVMAIVREKDRKLFEEVFKNTQPKVRAELNKTRRINSEGKTFGWILMEICSDDY